MPRLADHDRRKAQITDAARRIIARAGLPAATFQSVAAEAGVSVRLVQYYFGTKRAFLQATHHAVAADAGRRFTRSLSALEDGAPPGDVLRTLLAQLLPTDAPRRRDAVVLAAFHTAALTGSDDVDPESTLGAPRLLTDAIAAQVERAGGPADAHLTAEVVVAAAGGLAQSMVADPRTAERADQLLDRLLEAFGLVRTG